VYPALEILATAIVNLTGTTIVCRWGTLLLAVLRARSSLPCFCSTKDCPIGAPLGHCLSGLYGLLDLRRVDAMFSYESLGVVLCVLTFAAEAAYRTSSVERG